MGEFLGYSRTHQAVESRRFVRQLRDVTRINLAKHSVNMQRSFWATREKENFDAIQKLEEELGHSLDVTHGVRDLNGRRG